MQNLSEFWRKARSRQKAIELAQSLRALRKVAGHIGKDVKPIYWKGMADATDHSILLDPDLLPESFPISYQNFDLLVAKVALGSLASTEYTDQVKEAVHNSFDALPAAAAIFLNDFLDTAEEIYIDAVATSSIWSFYLSVLWNHTLKGFERDPSLPPTAKSLLQVWKKKVILKQEPNELELNYEAPLKILETHSQPLRKLAEIPIPQKRIDKRSELYQQIWSELWEEISKWNLFQPNLETVPGSESPINVKTEEVQNAEDGSLSQDLANEISWILEEGEIDLTRELLAVTQDPTAKPLETSLKNGTALMNVQPDSAQVKRLRRIFREHVSQVRRARNRNTRRGLLEGKLDPARLYRVPIDGKTFKSKQAPGFEDVWQICIIADASASMTGKGGNMRPWRIAEKTFATVIQAAKEFKNRIDIYAYFEESKKCSLTRLYHGKKLYTIKPFGQTPSGQAIMAVATLLDRKYKKNMIIHITDGAPNSGLPLTDAVAYCEKKGIQVFTIGCGCTSHTQQFLKETFPPGCVYLMKSIDYLAEGLETLFKQRILHQENKLV